MRRLIAYISMAIAVLLSVGVAFTPVFSKLNLGREYTSGREIVYRLSDKEDNSDLENDTNAASEVAKEMRARLDAYKVEDYSVRVEGNDTVRVSLSSNDELRLSYISKYLSFSGDNFSLASSSEGAEETRVTDKDDHLFDGKTAYITYVDNIIPYVIMPVNENALEKVRALINSFDIEEEKHEKVHAGEEEEKATPDIFLWANWAEGDDYKKAQDDAAITGQKIVAQFVHTNFWYEKSKDEKTEIAYLCGFSDSEGNYDPSKLKEATELATYICNIVNAPAYSYSVENLFVTQSSTGVSENVITKQATAENILSFDTNVRVAMSLTLISTLVALAVVTIILVLFYRLAALGMVASNVGTIFLTFVVFNAIGATFNIAALIGGIVLGLANLAISIVYMTKLKEEIYKGRTLKKANQEASKKINLLTIDVAVVLAFAGLMLYFLGGAALKPMGIIVFFGALFTIAMNLIVFKIMMWLLTNETKFQDNLKVINVETKLIPDQMKEEKATYQGPYQNTNFTKKRKLVGIITSVVALGAAVCIGVFGIKDGSALNVASSTQDTTEVYTSIKLEKPTLDTEAKFKEEILNKITVNGKEIEYKNVELHNREEYDYQSTITTKYTYFVTSINGTYKDSDVFTFELGGSTIETDIIDDAIYQLVSDYEGLSSDEYILVSAKVSHETMLAPSQGFVALASVLTIVGACLYFAFRYRPSRALSAFIVSVMTTTVAFGFFAMTRIAMSPIAAIIMPTVAIITLISSLLFFNKEKEMLGEHKKDELNLEKRNEVMIKATALAAAPLFVLTILGTYVSINFFGFGPKAFAPIFGGVLLGVVLATLLITSIMGPMGVFFQKAFSKIKLPTFKRKERKSRIKLKGKVKSSEPEETTFIGIND